MSALPFHISSSLLLMEKDNVPILHGGKQIVKVASHSWSRKTEVGFRATELNSGLFPLSFSFFPVKWGQKRTHLVNEVTHSRF